MAKYGRIQSDRKDLTQKIGSLMLDVTSSDMTGQIMLERNRVNLQNELFDADTPDFFWHGEHEGLEPVFLMVRKYLDIGKRAEIINRRLDVLKEVFDVCQTELDNRHAAKLEWIVIWLIILEVLISLFTFFYGQFAAHTNVEP
jgi:uncharacterized Rmd1/YagE family protein